MECIDLFSGAGGLTAGLHTAGFEAVAAVEVNEDCCATYSNAFPEVDLIPKPVQGIDFKRFSGIDLIAGGPPCQPFSSGGKGLANQDNRDMIPQFVRAIKEARPKAFIMENVFGLAGATHREYLNGIIQQLKALGYLLTRKVLNAADFGVPQKRRRLFIVGNRIREFDFPKPTHGPGCIRPHVPAGEFVSRDKVAGEENPSKVVYAKNPDLRPSPYDGHLFNGGGRAINLAAPSHTILASAGGNKTHFIDGHEEVPKYHQHLTTGGKPREGKLPGGRRLTVLESALLQTFKPDMKFSGSRSSQYTQVGNAVPPLLAEVLGKALMQHLE